MAKCYQERRERQVSDIKDLMAPSMTEEKQKALNDAKEKIRARYGENKKNYRRYI